MVIIHSVQIFRVISVTSDLGLHSLPVGLRCLHMPFCQKLCFTIL